MSAACTPRGSSGRSPFSLRPAHACYPSPSPSPNPNPDPNPSPNPNPNPTPNQVIGCDLLMLFCGILAACLDRTSYTGVMMVRRPSPYSPNPSPSPDPSPNPSPRSYYHTDDHAFYFLPPHIDQVWFSLGCFFYALMLYTLHTEVAQGI